VAEQAPAYFRVVAVDFDGTLADGPVAPGTLAVLAEARLKLTIRSQRDRVSSRGGQAEPARRGLLPARAAAAGASAGIEALSRSATAGTGKALACAVR